ncbi:hypothetical protein AAMO2058_000242700 [Amorphochlora amoebiformis]
MILFAAYKSYRSLKKNTNKGVWFKFWIVRALYLPIEAILDHFFYKYTFYPDFRVLVLAFLVFAQGAAQIWDGFLEENIEKGLKLAEKKYAEFKKKSTQTSS